MSGQLTTLNSMLQRQQNEAARKRAKTIYAICRNITPQFYNKQTPEEMETVVNTIELVTQGIREDILTTMCALAVKAYPLEKSKDAKTFFDVNYILGFYKEAWDYARQEQGFYCFCGVNEQQQLCYTTDEGFDWNKNSAKPNAPIWIDER